MSNIPPRTPMDFFAALATAFPAISSSYTPPSNDGVDDPEINADIAEDRKNIYVYAILPGFQKENINLEFFNNYLTISCHRNREYPEPIHDEISYGEFERTIVLPISITHKESVTTLYRDGILKISLNKEIEEENRFTVRVT